MGRLVVALVLGFYVVSDVACQEPEKLTGFWDLKITLRTGTEAMQEKKVRLAIGHDQGKLIIFDIDAPTKASECKVEGNRVQFTMNVKPKPDSKPVSIAFEGTISGKQFSGKGEVGSTKFEFKAEVVSVWACSNHDNPVDTATTEEQMRRLTRTKGCEGWHRLEQADAAKVVQ